jgi:acetyl-CoA carboxylase carboxyl transferase subunit alpha
MVNLKVPVICIIIGEGASGGALGIGIGDKVVMLRKYMVFCYFSRKLF